MLPNRTGSASSLPGAGGKHGTGGSNRLPGAGLTCASFPLDGGDKDARDSVRMWLEQRLRDGLEDGAVAGQQIGTFERYTKVSLACALRRGKAVVARPRAGGEARDVGRGQKLLER